jgi:hypothetical protein
MGVDDGGQFVGARWSVTSGRLISAPLLEVAKPPDTPVLLDHGERWHDPAP